MASLTRLLSAAIGSSDDVVVHCTRVGGRPRVTEIVAVEDLQTGAEGSAFTVTELFSRTTGDAPLRWTGNLPVRCRAAFDEVAIDLRALLDAGTPGSGALGRVTTIAGPFQPVPASSSSSTS
jgi:hypothetical protein